MHARSRLPATTTKTSHDEKRRSRSKSAIKTSRLVQPVLRAAGRRCSFDDSPSKRFEYLHRNELRSSLLSLSFLPFFPRFPPFFSPPPPGQRTFHVFTFSPVARRIADQIRRVSLRLLRLLDGNFPKRMNFIESLRFCLWGFTIEREIMVNETKRNLYSPSIVKSQSLNRSVQR